MIAARGILTSRGGKTSHAAVVARGMGKTCVCGADELQVDVPGKKFTLADGTVVSEGDMISIDGSSGAVYLGEVPVVASPVVEYFEGGLDPAADELVSAVHAIIQHADARAPAEGADQRRQRRGLRPRGPVRCPGHRPDPDRAHVPRRAAPAGGEPDPGRGRRRPPGRPGRPGAAAARRLRGDLRGHGRAAGHHPAAGPAAARVPARHHRADGQDRAGRRRGHGEGSQAAGGGPPPARAEPDARPARRPARPGHPRPVRHAGPGHRARGRRPGEGRRRPAAGDHDPARRRGPGTGGRARGDRAGAGRGRGGDRH